MFNINTPAFGAMGSVLSRPSANGGGALSDKQRQRRSTFAAFVKALDGKLLTAPAEESECETTPSIRGVAYTALLTSFGVHLVRLFLRDVLRKQSWYAAVEHPGMFELCALGSVHAAALAAYGLKKCFAPRTTWLDPRGCKRLCAVSLGYFLHDFLSLRSMWSQDPAMIVHHSMGILLLGAVLRKPAVYPVVAPFAVIELSTVFLNMMTMMTMAGKKGGAMFNANLGCFVSTFFVTRILWMPFITAKFLNKEPLVQLGATRWGLVVLSCLNVYWFRGIIAKIARAMAAPIAAAAATA